MAIPTHFSQEILDEIVGHLHDDRRTLKTLSITSSTFLPISREFLFDSISLRSTRCARWHDRLRDSPILRQTIGMVELYIGDLLDTDKEHITFILDSLSNPKRIGIRNRISLPISWEQMHPWLRTAIIKVMDKPTVHTVVVERCSDIPISFFSGTTHLQNIIFFQSGFTPNPERTPSDPLTPKIPVRGLYLSGGHYIRREYYDFVDHPEFPVDLGNLSRLQVDLLQDNGGKVQHILSVCGQSLHNLALNLKGGSASLQHLPALRVLQFWLWTSHIHSLHPMVVGLLSTLESLRTSDNHHYYLREISIIIYIEPERCVEIPAIDLWSDLDSVFANISVDRVRIHTVSGFPPDWTSLLPNLHKSGRGGLDVQ
ncbi:hypothetical protein BDN72DRAFT_957182 [Pluteus cervinus]|uniref:Uncharacterized protein n=1 Tax=Pluteus cervinus TaxID=181527 RepID=A0ACD3B309_9AGAR|nr:hypothetical protein BDN72DRAFT_957182 [Pluteus cervinus]